MLNRTLLWRIAVVVLLLSFAAPHTAAFADETHTPAQVTGPSQASFTVTTLNNAKLRTGPGQSYATITTIPYNTQLTGTGRNANASWIFVTYGASQGWVSATLLKLGGNANDLPVVDTIVPGGGGGGVNPTPTAPTAPGVATVTTKSTIRVRSGPGTNFAQLGLIPGKVTLTPIGRNANSQWVFIEYNGIRGWIAAWLTTVKGNINTLPVTSESGAGGGGGGTTPPPSNPGGFELGGQTHSLSNPGAMQRARMSWVKFQHKWSPGQDPSIVGDRINLAHAHGFKVLLSIPGELYPTSIDFAAYSRFVAGVAKLGADGIEVWNEMNFSREWPVGQINPATYVNSMLAPSYRAIKAANPKTLVISGALGPTGWNDGYSIMSDDQYVRGMQKAGAANYMDCLGVHHNAGATSPDATTGHPADAGDHHYSWYFKPTMNLYANTFPNTKLCFTELGYVTSEGYGPLPAGFWWGFDNSVGEQAQWLARSVTLSRQSGRVKMLIVFNVDFLVWSDTDPQAGYAIIRPGGGCPACDALAGAMQ